MFMGLVQMFLAIVSVSFLDLLTAMARGKGKAPGVHELLVKMMRAELHGGPQITPFSELDEFVAQYSVFICCVLSVCLYPTVSILSKAGSEAWELSSEHSLAFSSRICKAITFSRNKLKSMSSGAKLSKGVSQICLALQNIKDSRRLSRRVSSPSKPSKMLSPSKTSLVSSASSKASKSEIMAIYGVEDTFATGLPFAASPDAFSISSSAACEVSSAGGASLSGGASLDADSEVEAGQGLSPTMSTENLLPISKATWLCSKDMVLKRMLSNGEVETATMAEGPKGFAVATWKDGSEAVETELPNLSLALFQEASLCKRPASNTPRTKAPVQKKAKKRTETKRVVEEASEESSPLCVQGEFKNFQFESPVHGLCKAEFYTAKSYIRQKDQAAKNKWTLIIGSSHKQHKAVIAQLAKLVAAGNSKESLHETRAKLHASSM